MQQDDGMAASFESLGAADLIVDGLYGGHPANDLSADPISRLLPVGNVGGIRIRGTATKPSLVVLVTGGEDIDWPDSFDPVSGELLYFGDNKTEGRELHDTPRNGNVVLRNLFDVANGSGRATATPVFVFRRAGSTGRNYRFLGLAVPGGADVDFRDDLVAIWRTRRGLRFQNYRATFTVLDAPVISRAWIYDILAGDSLTPNAPASWRAWCGGGPPTALRAPRTAKVRSTDEQLPSTSGDTKLIADIHRYFSPQPHEFEHFAAFLVKLALPAVVAVEVTRRSRDGGRDALGKYRIGRGEGSIEIDFALEAKCYSPTNGVGVREMSRLISRLRHRQFGVLVTTSFVSSQTYSEIVEDSHPIVVIAGRDIADLLRGSDIPITPSITDWLSQSFPLRDER